MLETPGVSVRDRTESLTWHKAGIEARDKKKALQGTQRLDVA